MLGIGEENRTRTRIALALALLGLALIVTGVATAILGGNQQVTVGPPAPAAPPRTLAHQISNLLFLLVLLVGIMMFSTLILLHWTRRYRKWLFHKPHPPTPSSDVWSMHKTPPEEAWPSADPGENPSPDSRG